MATYLNTNGTSETFDLTERYIYGSSRVGVYKEPVSMLATPGNPAFHYVRPGYRQYELSNHLGNVTTTITAQKVPLYSGTTIIGFAPQIVKSFDYSPFGVTRVDFDVTARLGGPFEVESGVRYGFNGKERDDEVSGSGNQYDYGFRIYNPRVGRFLSIDPLTGNYPWYTPYQFAGNKPIWAIDVDGLEEYIYQYTLVGKEATFIRVIKNSELKHTIAGDKRYSPVVHTTVVDKRTGKPMDPKEIGMAQYQYFDKENNRVKMRRTMEGEYEAGDNEFMINWTSNMLESVYIGSNNPPPIGGQEDYRREPQDEADFVGMNHDQEFDSKQLKGLKGTLSSESTPFNLKAIEAAENILEKKTDKITGKPVTDLTRARAKRILLFRAVENLKSKEKEPDIIRFGE